MWNWRAIRNLQVFERLVMKTSAVFTAVDTDGKSVSGTSIGKFNVANAGTFAALSSATTLLRRDSGKTIVLDSATGFAVTLPAAESGLKFSVVVGDTPPTSGNHTLVSAETANIYGNLIVNGAKVPAVDEDNIAFVASNAVQGDQIELVSDGTDWYLTGTGNAVGSITANT